MIDKMGNKLNIGDKVCYSKKDSNHLAFGIIIEFDDTWGSLRCLITTEKGFKAKKYRTSDDILSIEPYKVTNPEYFI